MKKRTGFVSNSSSSSFILDRRKVSSFQEDIIKKHITYAEEHFPGLFYTGDYSWWSVTSEGDLLKFYTDMDNFNMEKFLRLIGISDDAYIERRHS